MVIEFIGPEGIFLKKKLILTCCRRMCVPYFIMVLALIWFGLEIRHRKMHKQYKRNKRDHLMTTRAHDDLKKIMTISCHLLQRKKTFGIETKYF